MTLRLVSDARPIPENRLSRFEQDKLEEADVWMKAVRDAAERRKPVADEIAWSKGGRVLFINGPRGAGKTSLLLTLLHRWQKKTRETGVLLPILDFDPLPRGMPLHGWLLEPWRKEARRVENEAGGGADGKDLRELWADVFERAVLGWSEVTGEGKGIVEKALAYEEQASGWVDMRSHWYELVNTVVERRCSPKGSKAWHPFVFVVAIDDVDLQVEQVPELLHAIRLLHHPNVAYVLTGDMGHLHFVLELDYIQRHGVDPIDVEISSASSKAHDLSRKIRSYSRALSDALLEKALPRHSIIDLPPLNLEDVLKMHISGEGETPAVAAELGEQWRDLPNEVKLLPIATARHAQHAIDRGFHPSSESDGKRATKFIADLCGTDVDSQNRVFLRGRLTTLSGPVFHTWEGDRLSIQLRDQPPFAFQPQFIEADQRLGSEANRAAVIQFVAERELIKAPDFDWRPEAGIVTTEVEWESDVSGIDGNALFHWPWLIRPTVLEMLHFRAVAEQMRKSAGDASDRINLPQEMILVWLRQNIEWQYQREGNSSVRCPSLDSFKATATELRRLSSREESPLTKLKQDEVSRWAHQLLVMTAPYFGLPDDKVASPLRAELERHRFAQDRPAIIRVEKRMIEDAIHVSQLDGPRRNRLFEDNDRLRSSQFDDAVVDFLQKWENMAPTRWWTWREGRFGKGRKTSGKARKQSSSAARPPKRTTSE